MNDKTKLYIAAILGVAMVVGCSMIGDGLTNFHKAAYEIKVTGKAEKTIESDYIVWHITLTSTGADRQSAYRNYESDHATLSKYLKDQNIPANEIEEHSPSISEKSDSYYKNGNWVTEKQGYNVMQSITISSTNLAVIEKAYNKVQSLYATGIDIDSHSLQYYYTRLNDLKMEMLKEASADAYERAKVIADGCDARVGKLKNLNMGVFQILGVNCDEDYSWGGTYNTSSKLKQASITVRADYESK